MPQRERDDDDDRDGTPREVEVEHEHEAVRDGGTPRPDGEAEEHDSEDVAELRRQRAFERSQKQRAQRDNVRLQGQVGQLEQRLFELQERFEQDSEARAARERHEQRRAEATAAEADWRKAREAGDEEATASAFAKMVKAQLAAEREPSEQDDDPEPRPTRRQQQPQQRQPAQPSPAAQAWLRRTSWYAKPSDDPDDELDRQTAFAVMQGLAAQRQDLLDTDEFFVEVDKALKKRLPHRYQARGNGSTAGAGRAGASSPSLDNLGEEPPKEFLEGFRRANFPVDDPNWRKTVGMKHWREHVAREGTTKLPSLRDLGWQ